MRQRPHQRQPGSIVRDGHALAHSGAGAGELASITYPSGAVLSYQYDATGALIGMRWNGQPLLQNIAYNALGQPLSWTWRFAHASASLPASRRYNLAGQLVGNETGTYTWNRLGQLSAFSPSLLRSNETSGWVAENVPHSASYDATGRLLQLRAQGSVPALQSLQDYAYDANGNRTGTGLLVDTASNRLRQAQSQPVVTNSAGEITWQAGRALRFDAGGRLHQVKACASATDSACASSEDGATRHWYNGQHQRVLKDEPTGQTVYAYGTAGHNVLGEYRQAAGAGAVQSTEHIYLPTASGPMPVAAVINGQHFAVHTDHLNTPRRLTDSARRVRWQWAYSGYGETAPQALTLPTVANVAYNLRFPGQVDDGNGLFYNWHRFYHPASGRYVSADPIGLNGGWNRFAYVGGNALSGVDPTGLMTFESWWEASKAGFQSGNNNPWGEVNKILQGIVPGEGAFVAAFARGLGAIKGCFTPAARGVPIDGLAFELKHLDKHLQGSSAANRLIRKEGAAHVFENKGALAAAERAIMERGQFTGSVRGWDRYGLQFESPIGFRIGADGSRTPLRYGEIKVREGMYHVIPRTGPGQ